MHSFTAIIQKFSNKGEKTGWTYVDLPPDIATAFKLKSKKEFRVKGVMDDVPFERLACYPIGDGNFIVAINADLRKKLGKKEGAMLKIKITTDSSEPLKSQELVDCLADDKIARQQFESLTKSHQHYFHNYINSAKTLATKTARVVSAMDAMHKKINYGEMIRSLKSNKHY